MYACLAAIRKLVPVSFASFESMQCQQHVPIQTNYENMSMGIQLQTPCTTGQGRMPKFLLKTLLPHNHDSDPAMHL